MIDNISINDAYYDGLNINVFCEGFFEYTIWSTLVGSEKDGHTIQSKHFNTRNEAYKEAFNKVNEIVNNE